MYSKVFTTFLRSNVFDIWGNNLWKLLSIYGEINLFNVQIILPTLNFKKKQNKRKHHSKIIKSNNQIFINTKHFMAKHRLLDDLGNAISKLSKDSNMGFLEY